MKQGYFEFKSLTRNLCSFSVSLCLRFPPKFLEGSLWFLLPSCFRALYEIHRLVWLVCPSWLRTFYDCVLPTGLLLGRYFSGICEWGTGRTEYKSIQVKNAFSLKPCNSGKFANSEAGAEFGIFKVLNYSGWLCKWRMFLSWSGWQQLRKHMRCNASNASTSNWENTCNATR